MAPRRRTDDEASVARSEPRRPRRCCSLLHRAGASFFADIVRGTRTAEGRSGNGAVGTGRRRPGHRRRLRQPARAHRPRAPRRPRLRPKAHGRVTAPAAGRCCTPATVGATRRDASKPTCWMLLRRYGVVFRELLARESVLPTWRELLIDVPAARGSRRGARRPLRRAASSASSSRCPIAVESLRAATTRAARAARSSRSRRPIRSTSSGSSCRASVSRPSQADLSCFVTGSSVATEGDERYTNSRCQLGGTLPILGNTLPTRSKGRAFTHPVI